MSKVKYIKSCPELNDKYVRRDLCDRLEEKYPGIQLVMFKNTYHSDDGHLWYVDSVKNKVEYTDSENLVELIQTYEDEEEIQPRNFNEINRSALEKRMQELQDSISVIRKQLAETKLKVDSGDILVDKVNFMEFEVLNVRTFNKTISVSGYDGTVINMKSDVESLECEVRFINNYENDGTVKLLFSDIYDLVKKYNLYKSPKV